MRPALAQLNISPGGVPKKPIDGAQVTQTGIAGDWQRDRKHGGGTDRAICLYSEELYDRLREQGIDLQNGSVGENFTTRGIDLGALRPGDCLRVGKCLIEITDVRVPCESLNQWDQRLLKTVQSHSGWVARVVEEGFVKAGDGIRVVRSDSVKE